MSKIMKLNLFVTISILFFSLNAFCRKSGNNMDNKNMSFMQKAYSGGMMEVELGRLAQHNASSDKVKQFGERIIVDHTQANKELKTIAQKNNINLSDKMLTENQSMYDQLAKFRGSEFDKQYMNKMVEDHKADISEFEQSSGTETNKEIHQWIINTLPILRQHLKLAQEILAKMGQTN